MSEPPQIWECAAYASTGSEYYRPRTNIVAGHIIAWPTLGGPKLCTNVNFLDCLRAGQLSPRFTMNRGGRSRFPLLLACSPIYRAVTGENFHFPAASSLILPEKTSTK